jgi:hypothetical protein
VRIAVSLTQPLPEIARPGTAHSEAKEPLPVGPLVYRRRLRAALEAEIGRLYADTLQEPVPPRMLGILRRKTPT